MIALTDPVALAQALICCPSVTPEDEGAQRVLAESLVRLGFDCHHLRFDEPGTAAVDNLYARLGEGRPHLAFAGHTDVVPPGDAEAWQHGPFDGVVDDGMVHGRGAVDMKGAIACFTAAVARVLRDHQPKGSISLLITGDEEGPAINGTRKLLDWLAARNETIDACIVGEPTNPRALGEMVKVGRRGSLTGHLTVTGTQGHVAYPDKADNPIPRLLDLLGALCATRLDDGSAHFQPSQLVITTVDVGNPVSNLIPATATATFNVRYNDRHSAASLEAELRARLGRTGQPYDLKVEVSGEAFVTEPSPFTALVASAIERVTGQTPELSTSGGTSDARFIKDLCPVVEFGLVGSRMHQVDEQVSVADLEGLTRIYQALLEDYVVAGADQG